MLQDTSRRSNGKAIEEIRTNKILSMLVGMSEGPVPVSVISSCRGVP